MTRKSVPSAKAIEKSFAASAGNKPVNEKLSKSMALNELSKAIDEGKTQFISDILALEGTGDFSALSAEAKHMLNIQ
jgi:hypothetical protein